MHTIQQTMAVSNKHRFTIMCVGIMVTPLIRNRVMCGGQRLEQPADPNIMTTSFRRVVILSYFKTVGSGILI